ncbi:MAG TPA: polysaccharide biosynthesis tyrosine autokinase [Mycobacteriales bacterium]|nr:polysaccharide biosynthesis tyrosine autokinase [Mycobacteriales bacterium]
MDLLQFFSMVRRRLALILLCIIAGTAGAAYYAKHHSKTYTATAQAIFQVPDTRTLGDTVGGTFFAANQTVTYATVATSRAVAARIITLLHLQDSPADVARHLSATVEKNTEVLDVSATSNTAKGAQALADAAVTALSDEVTALQATQSAKITANVLDYAELPSGPTSPNPPLDITLGVLLGIVAGLGGAALLETLDRTVKSSAHGDALYAAPMLGVVPKRRGGMLVVRRDSDSAEAEPYKTLRTAVRFVAPDRPLRTLLVTSAGASEGKTTTVANLAVAIALSGERVIVLDADLRRARLANAFGLEYNVGLTSLVLGTASIADALQPWDRSLQVMASGPLPPNPSEIVGSQLFNQLLRSLSEMADFVVIDAPPVLPVTDAVAIAAQVDGVLLVTRHGKTPRSAAAEARRKLAGVGANVIGYVLNAVPARDAHSYYADYEYQQRGMRSPAGAAGQPAER